MAKSKKEIERNDGESDPGVDRFITRYWYENGESAGERIELDGRLSKEELWYENGQPKAKHHYQSGVPTVKETWHKNGEKQSLQRYLDGKEVGVSREWYENGQLQSQVPFTDGQRYGTARYWYANGSVKGPYTIQEWPGHQPTRVGSDWPEGRLAPLALAKGCCYSTVMVPSISILM